MSKETWTTYNTCHLCYQPTTRGVEKQTCPVLVMSIRLDLDASCNENGPSLFSNPTPCFLVPVIIKCNELVTMEAQTLLDCGASTCFMYKELMQQYKLALMENNILVQIEVING